MSDSLSLFRIDETLAQLIELRTEVASTEPVDAEALAEIETQIQKYMNALPAKVDGVAAYALMLRSRREAVHAEASRLKAMEASLAGQIEKLDGYITAVLEKQPLPAKGPRKLAGNLSEIRLVGNGGLAPLVVSGWNKEKDRWDADPGLLPDELCSIVRIPNNKAIRAALEEECGVCGPFGFPDIECAACGGTRRAGVAGAHLDPRGSHISIK